MASPRLSIYDDGAMPGLVGSKGITCEGLPTGRTDLIRHGRLTGCLANWYSAQRLLRDPALRDKLGATGPIAEAALTARNGFRFGAGGGRQFDSPPSVAASNIVVEGEEPVSHEELLRTVGDGLYIGRIWYTYPINGPRAGDFTCTVVADSYIIRGGRIVAPLRANAIRINDNIATFLNNVIGVTKDARATIVWAADEVVYAPEVAVSGVRIDEIADPQRSCARWLTHPSSTRSPAPAACRSSGCSPTPAPGIRAARSRSSIFSWPSPSVGSATTPSAPTGRIATASCSPRATRCRRSTR